MGIFYKRTTDRKSLVLESRPAMQVALFALLGLLVLVQARVADLASEWFSFLFLALVIVRTIEMWPVMRASWSKRPFEKRGSHIFSFRNPTQYRVPLQ